MAASSPPLWLRSLAALLFALFTAVGIDVEFVSGQTPTAAVVRNYTLTRATSATAMAVDGGGSLYVVSAAGSQVLKLAPDSTVLATFPPPSSAMKLNSATGIALDGSGNVYVSDSASAIITGGRILKWSPSGALLLNFTSPAWSAPAQLRVDSKGLLYLLDGLQKAVFKHGPDGSLLQSFNASNSPLAQPRLIALDPYDRLYAMEATAQAVLALDQTTSGASVSRSYNATGGDVLYSYGLAVDGYGDVFTVGYRPKGVVKQSPAGNLTVLLPTTGDYLGYTSIMLDQRGSLFISDALGYVWVMSDLNPPTPNVNSGAHQTARLGKCHSAAIAIVSTALLLLALG